MKTFDSFAELREKDYATYKLISKLSHFPDYRQTGKTYDMANGGWQVLKTPELATDAQWATISKRMLNYIGLRDKTLPEVLEGFYFPQESVVVEGVKYYIPTGDMNGWMQGMFMGIDPNGNINT